MGNVDSQIKSTNTLPNDHPSGPGAGSQPPKECPVHNSNTNVSISCFSHSIEALKYSLDRIIQSFNNLFWLGTSKLPC